MGNRPPFVYDYYNYLNKKNYDKIYTRFFAIYFEYFYLNTNFYWTG